MEYSGLIIFLLLLVIVVVPILTKKPSIAKKDSKPENQESKKSVSIDRKCKKSTSFSESEDSEFRNDWGDSIPIYRQRDAMREASNKYNGDNDMEKENKSLHPKIKIEFYDQRNYEEDILSVPAGKTKHLIDEYHIHSCPNTDPYKYKRTKYITFRAGGTGEMDALYKIKIILTLPTHARNNLNVLENHGFTSDEVQRLTDYMKRNPFQDNHRYYVLSKVIDLAEKSRPLEVHLRPIYYTLHIKLVEN